jgi:hypothetical protein
MFNQLSMSNAHGKARVGIYNLGTIKGVKPFTWFYDLANQIYAFQHTIRISSNQLFEFERHSS